MLLLFRVCKNGLCGRGLEVRCLRQFADEWNRSRVTLTPPQYSWLPTGSEEFATRNLRLDTWTPLHLLLSQTNLHLFQILDQPLFWLFAIIRLDRVAFKTMNVSVWMNIWWGWSSDYVKVRRCVRGNWCNTGVHKTISILLVKHIAHIIQKMLHISDRG